MTETDIAGKTICSLGKRRINIKKAVAVVAIITGILITSAGAETIQLVRGHGVYMIPVQINGQMTVPFTLDSGAAEVAIPQDIFLTLIRTETIKDSDFVGTGTYVMADGSEHSSKRFILRELKVGNHVVTNVIANVVSVKADPLLGQSFLSKLPAWAVDNRNHSLILHDQSGLTAPPATSLAQPPASTPYGDRQTRHMIDCLHCLQASRRKYWQKVSGKAVLVCRRSRWVSLRPVRRKVSHTGVCAVKMVEALPFRLHRTPRRWSSTADFFRQTAKSASQSFEGAPIGNREQ